MHVNMAENAYPTPPHDSLQDDASPQPQPPTPERIRYLPEWEVPTHPPKHRRQGSESLFTRLLQIPTALTIPSPTITLPDALKRHQTTLSPRPRAPSRGRSTPISKNDISAPFGFTHTSTGNPSPVSSMARLQREMTLGTPTGSGPLLPMHHAGPRYGNTNAVPSPMTSTFSPSPPSSPLQRSQTQRPDHVYNHESQQARDHDQIYDQESPQSPDHGHIYMYNQESHPSPDHDHVYDQEPEQAPDEKTARITSGQPSEPSALSPMSIFPRIKSRFSATTTSAAPPPSPMDSGSQNPQTPNNQFSSPRALGFLGSSPPNANQDRGHQRYESAGNPTLESGGYGTRESQLAEKPLFPMNLPPKRRRMLFVIIPLSTILLVALILGLGLGLGLRSRFDDTNRLSRGGASSGDHDGSGNLGSGNDGSSTVNPSTLIPSPTSRSTSPIPIPTNPNSDPTAQPTPSLDPNSHSSPLLEPSAIPNSSIEPRPDPQPTVLPIPDDPTLPSTLYPSPESSPAGPESSIWTKPSPTPDNPNPDSSPIPNPSPSPEPIPSPNDPTGSPPPNDPGTLPTPAPAPAPPEDPNEPYQPYEPGQPGQEAPQYGKPTPTNTASEGSGNGNGNGNGPSPTTGTGGGSDTAPQPQPSDLPLPPPFSTNTGPFKGNFFAYNAVGVGACGEVNTDNDLIGAVAWEVFDAASTLAAKSSPASGGCMAGSGSPGAGSAAGGFGDGGTGSGAYGGGSLVNCGYGEGSKNPLGNPNDNPLCGRKIRVFLDNVNKNQQDDGIIVRIVDRCTSCRPSDFGLSLGVFSALGDGEATREGRARGVWQWVQ